MKLREFFERLPKDGGYLGPCGYIRRGEVEDIDNVASWGQCPISSLDGAPACGYRRVGGELGINEFTQSRIAAAADNCVSRPSDRLLRRLLLSHCGLSETANEGSGT